MIIDSLTHILPMYFDEKRDEAITRDATFRELFSNPKARIAQDVDLLREMDAAEVDVSVIAGFGWNDKELARLSNDYILECAEKHRGRLIPVCSVNPSWGGEVAVEEALRCLDAGAVGIGELHADTQGWVEPPYDAMSDLAEVVRGRDAVMIVHASEPIGHLYAGKGTLTPDLLLNLARTYPENRFVFSHFGGGLPFYEQMPEVKRDLKNVYYDTAAAPFLYDRNVYGSVTQAVGAGKLMFASDFPLVAQRRALDHIRSAELAGETSERILHLNAELVFNSSLTPDQIGRGF